MATDSTTATDVRIGLVEEPKIYQYTPLPANSIRVIDIHPGQPSDPLSCEILIHSLTESEPYEGLSYAWGSPDKVSKLLCDGGEAHIPITASLATALENLRLEDSTRRIWADAVCINQTDNEEKGAQIGIMAQIYSRAARTVVFLGPSDETTELAIEVLYHVARLCLKIIGRDIENVDEIITMRPSDFFNDFEDNDFVRGHPQGLDPDNDSDKEWEAISAFFDARWFTRMWAIQEVTLGNSPLLYRGTHSIPWNIVLVSSFWAGHWDEFRGRLPVQWVLPSLMHSAFLHPPDLNPTYLIQSSQTFEATDPRDKIYALLSFKGMSFPPKYAITADYSLSLAEVYTKAFVACVMHSRHLEVLRRVYHPDSTENEEFEEPLFNTPGGDLRKDGFPTWLPRWDIRDGYGGVGGSMAVSEGLDMVHQMDTLHDALYRVAWGTFDEMEAALGTDEIESNEDQKEGVERVMPTRKEDPKMEVQGAIPARKEIEGRVSEFSFAPAIILPRKPGETSITVRCIKIGTCRTGSVALFKHWWNRDNPGSITVLLAMLMKRVITDHPEVLHDDHQVPRIFEELSTVLLAGHSPGGDPDTKSGEQLTQAMLAAWNVFLNIRERKEEACYVGDALVGFPATSEFDREQVQDALKWVQEAAKWSNDRRIFMCNGHLGNGPSAMRIDDIVVVPYGADAPYVLRPFGGQWQVVGACYLFGYMNGEAAEMYKNWELEMDLFELI